MLMEAIFTEIPIVETENYLLRGLTIEDSETLYTFMHDRETMKFITPHPVQSIDETRIVVQGQLEKYQAHKEVPWIIINKSNEEIVGQFRLHKLDLFHKKAETGVVIRKKYQNTGVMTEIFKEVIEFGFDKLGLNRMVGDIFAGNQGSEKLLKKYGFTKEGVLRQTDFDGEMYHDTVVYSMMRSEYEELRKS